MKAPQRRRNRETETCYMCDAPMTSREHAPPLCFFPETELFGENVRKELITVPSCDQHNSKKSQDDEFFRVMVLMKAATISDAGRHQFVQKVRRAAARSPSIYNTFYSVTDHLPDSRVMIQFDRERFDRCVDHMCRALAFHTVGVKWKHRLRSWSPSIVAGSAGGKPVEYPPYVEGTKLAMDALQDLQEHGANPSIFKYRLYVAPDNTHFGLAAEFYNAYQVFAFSRVDDQQPTEFIA